MSRDSAEKFDVIVVGGGAAGCVLAARLSEDSGRDVLLLEAGPLDSDPRITAPHGAFQIVRGELDWSYETVPQARLGGRRVPFSAGRVLGGGSSTNFLAWFRGHHADYDGWAGQGMTGWSWNDVLPAFIRSEDHELGRSAHHGTGGPMPVTTPADVSPISLAFIAAAVEAGLPLNRDFTGPSLDGAGLMYGNVRDGERYSTARAYLHPAMGRSNLTVRTGALVQRLLTVGHRVVGVEYTDGHGDRTVAHADTVVMAAGGIRSCQLLMLSGIGPADHLREHGIDVVMDLPGVGKNLQDHPGALVIWPVVHGETWLDAYARQPDSAGGRRGPLAAIGQAGAFLRCGEGAQAPDVQLTPVPIDFTGSTRPSFTCLVTLLTPSSRGSVRLTSRDASENPEIDMNYLAAECDRTVLLEGVRRTLELGDLPVLRSYVGPPTVPSARTESALEESLTRHLVSFHHPAGTCRSGVDPDSVVDPALRVHGVAGLYVADASIMPALPRGNTHAPSVMIGERAADIIDRHHR